MLEDIDHRKLGQLLELFTFSQKVGSIGTFSIEDFIALLQNEL